MVWGGEYMTDVVHLPDNFIGKDDQAKLESFGSHEIARGRATRWCWTRDDKGGDAFEIRKGGAREVLVVRITRDRKRDLFSAHGPDARLLAEGALDHLMAVLDAELARLHGEEPA